MENARRSGWWLIGGLGVLTLLGLYVGAYCATVQPTAVFGVLDHTSNTLQFKPQYGHLGSAGELIFRPVHFFDRRLRRGYWSEPIDDVPRIPAGY